MKTTKTTKTTKTVALAAVILAGTIGIGIGTAHAGEGNAAGKVPTIELNGVTYRVGIDTDVSWEPRIASDTQPVEVGTYEGREATETGKLPSGGNSVSSGSESPGPEGFQNLKFGGAKVREGLDTTP